MINFEQRNGNIKAGDLIFAVNQVGNEKNLDLQVFIVIRRSYWSENSICNNEKRKVIPLKVRNPRKYILSIDVIRPLH